jgi:hypothetical protein
MQPLEIHTLSVRSDSASTWSWRHMLMWRQLSTLWKLRVVEDDFCAGKNAEPWSMVIDAAACESHRRFQIELGGAPGIIFLDGVCLDYDFESGIARYEVGRRRRGDGYRHTLRLEVEHALLEGLPKTVPVYGEATAFTPLKIQPGMTALVSLNGIPIIAALENVLVVGADPWQFGDPGVPVLYKVISNWLRISVGYEHPVMKPIAAIRIDDLPTTAEELRRAAITDVLDKRRSRTLRRLFSFSRETGAKFSVMYSTHFRDGKGSVRTIRSVMPRSIQEIRSAVQLQTAEIGSHGMIHLRDSLRQNQAEPDPREFMDLDELQTAAHVLAAEREILDSFQTSPASFVAPAWGYRPGITKKTAARNHSVICDSSQNVESGTCDVLLADGRSATFFNLAETFRCSKRVLSYTDPAFWSCYAGCGIPVHYMQHTDTNWQLLRAFLAKDGTGEVSHSRILNCVNDPRRPQFLRVAGAVLALLTGPGFRPSAWEFLWRALTRSSIYSIVRALQSAGYAVVTITEFTSVMRRYEEQWGAQQEIACGAE